MTRTSTPARPLVAETVELALLEDPEKLHLDGGGDLADLVEKDRAAIGELEPSLASALRAGVRAPDMTEELAGDELLGQGRAVDADERAVLPAAGVVDRPGDELLAGPALTAHQHGRVEGRDLLDHLEHAHHRVVGPDHVLRSPGPLRRLARLRFLTLQAEDLVEVVAIVLDRIADDEGDDGEQSHVVLEAVAGLPLAIDASVPMMSFPVALLVEMGTQRNAMPDQSRSRREQVRSRKSGSSPIREIRNGSPRSRTFPMTPSPGRYRPRRRWDSESP